MTISATYDANARVSLATTLSGTEYKWYKNNVLFDTTAVPSVVDNRPQKNYAHVNYTNPGGSLLEVAFSFTGVEFAIFADFILYGYVIDVDIDGNSFTCDTTAHMADHIIAPVENQIVWGKAGLANEEHTVTMTIAAPVGGKYLNQFFRGYAYSDLSLDYGTQITYKVLVDDSQEETILVTPIVHHKNALQSLVDRLIDFGFPSGVVAVDAIQYIADVAGMYYLTEDSRLIDIADTLYDIYMAGCDGNGYVLDLEYESGGETVQDASITLNGRIAHNFWFAYKVFGDSRYLAVSDNLVTKFCSSWPTVANIWQGCAYYDWSGKGTTQYIANQMAAPCYGLALCYNEASSVHYQSSTVNTVLFNNADIIASTVDDTTGAMYYASYKDAPDRVYAAYTWPMLQYISSNFTWNTADAARATGWWNDDLPIEEPYFWISIFFGYTYSCFNFVRALTEYTENSAFPRNFADMCFSAAFDGYSVDIGDGSDPDYRPAGWEADTPITAIYPTGLAMFWTSQFAYSLGIPLKTWMETADASWTGISDETSYGTTLEGTKIGFTNLDGETITITPIGG